jgi:hypothetical protein
MKVIRAVIGGVLMVYIGGSFLADIGNADNPVAKPVVAAIIGGLLMVGGLALVILAGVEVCRGLGLLSVEDSPSTSHTTQELSPGCASASSGASLDERLRTLKDLLAKGLITETEYAKKRDQLLDEV